MSKLGGYQIVNLAGVNLTDTGVTFKGLYGRLFKDIGKPVLLSGVVLYNQSYQDCYVQPVYTLEGFKMTVGDYTITVTVDDLVLSTYGIIGGGGSGSDIPPLNPDGVGEVLTNIGSETMGWVPNHDVPSGGLSGEVLAKATNADYALQWVTKDSYSTFSVSLISSEDIETASEGDALTVTNNALASVSSGYIGNRYTSHPFAVYIRDNDTTKNYYGCGLLKRHISNNNRWVGLVPCYLFEGNIPKTLLLLSIALTTTSAKPTDYNVVVIKRIDINAT